MEDILNMSIDDFNGVFTVWHDKAAAMSGKSVSKPLIESQKEMIRQAKEKIKDA